MNRKTEQDYKDVATANGMEWIGEMPADVLQRTQWRCAKGHVFEMRYTNLQIRRRCPICSRRWRRQLDDYRKIGEPHGLSFVGRHLPRNTREKTYWLLDQRLLHLSYRSIAIRTRHINELSPEELDRITVDANHALLLEREEYGNEPPE